MYRDSQIASWRHRAGLRKRSPRREHNQQREASNKSREENAQQNIEEGAEEYRLEKPKLEVTLRMAAIEEKFVRRLE